MQMETAMLQHTMAYVKEHCAPEIALLDVDVPRIGAIPCIRFAISMDTLARICETLNCEITDVIELVPDEPAS